MKVAIVYDTRTETTARAADFIKEGIAQVEGVTAECFCITDADKDKIRAADGVIMGSPTYMACTTGAMQQWLQTVAPELSLAGKLGGGFATEQYIHGGGENAIAAILTHELVFGMLVYSGGGAFGRPVIHFGPVGMSQNIEDFRDLFITYGKRFATTLANQKAR